MGKVEHTLKPFMYKEAKVLILGTMPSPKSREMGFYYAHPQNRFWKTLASVFGDKEPESIEQKKAFLYSKKIALWDVLEVCDIDGAADSSIKNAKANDILRRIKDTEIKYIFTTGKKACDLLKKLCGLDSVCLPSPSPANCAVSMEKLIEEYTAVKLAVKGEL